MLPFPNYESYCFVPSDYGFPSQQYEVRPEGNDHLLQHLNAKLTELDRGNQELQANLDKLKKEFITFQQGLIQSAREIIKREIQKSGKALYNFFFSQQKPKKHKRCIIDGCSRKYSSKIALRAHLRKMHNFRTQQDFQGKIF